MFKKHWHTIILLKTTNTRLVEPLQQELEVPFNIATSRSSRLFPRQESGACCGRGVNFSLTYMHPGAMQQATFDSTLDNITNHGEIVGKTEKRHSEKASLNSPKYITNPDVVLREEDKEGALLFNPDTNQIKVLNPTGLFIWQLCDGHNNLPSIVAAMREVFDAVPEDQVTSDTTEFIDEMTTTGFIGIVENQKNK